MNPTEFKKSPSMTEEEKTTSAMNNNSTIHNTTTIPYSLTCSMAEDGLGVMSWWHGTNEEEVDDVVKDVLMKN